MLELINIANAIGIYQGEERELTSNEVITNLSSNISITKTANKIAWATGTLTFTITIKNPNLAIFNNIVVTDILDPELITLITDSVRINNLPVGYGIINYNYDNGLLTVNIPTISSNNEIVINFQVIKRRRDIFILENYATLESYEIENPISKSLNKEKINDENKMVSNIITIYGYSEVCRCRANEINLWWLKYKNNK